MEEEDTNYSYANFVPIALTELFENCLEQLYLIIRGLTKKDQVIHKEEIR